MIARNQWLLPESWVVCDSAVSDATTDILLESACFDPSMIRKSAKKAAISSDASYRYERGIDPHNVRRSAECAVALILELAGGRVEEAQEWGYVSRMRCDR